MRLIKMWEYSISREFESKEYPQQGEFKAWNILSTLNPETGWTEIFSLLAREGYLKNLRRIQNCSCYAKEFLTHDS